MNKKIKLVTVIGARPQIIKAAALSRAIRGKYAADIEEVIVHTGQHYDANMSHVFFEELQIPAPNYNLNVGSGSHGLQTAKMLEGLEQIFISENPDFIVLYGDTNSTLAGAVAAAKLHINIVHVEAGLRSYNKSMPEEINRIMCDHASTLLFSPTKAGVVNLQQEGFKLDSNPPYSSDNPKVYHCGDIMFDNSVFFSELAEKSDVIERNNLERNNFILGTIHRDSNTDVPERLQAIFSAFIHLSEALHKTIILPLHPRTKKLLSVHLTSEILDKITDHIRIIEPVSFLEMIMLEKYASLVITDSGGVQKEAYFFKKPCIILRQETEWIELVELGNAIIADADTDKIVAAYTYFANNKKLEFPSIFGDGKAAEFICSEIVECYLKQK